MIKKKTMNKIEKCVKNILQITYKGIVPMRIEL